MIISNTKFQQLKTNKFVFLLLSSKGQLGYLLLSLLLHFLLFLILGSRLTSRSCGQGKEGFTESALV